MDRQTCDKEKVQKHNFLKNLHPTERIPFELIHSTREEFFLLLLIICPWANNSHVFLCRAERPLLNIHLRDGSLAFRLQWRNIWKPPTRQRLQTSWRFLKCRTAFSLHRGGYVFDAVAFRNSFYRKVSLVYLFPIFVRTIRATSFTKSFSDVNT